MYLFVKDAVDKGFEPGQVVLARIPDDFRVDAEVLVDQDIAHILDPAPEQNGMPCAEVIAEVVRRLADDIKISHDGIEQHIVGQFQRIKGKENG